MPFQYRIFEPRRGLREIDQRAWRCLERCRKRQKLDSIPLPVPVENWIEGPLGIRFGFTDLSHLGKDVLGAAYVRANEIMIDPKSLSNEARCRFTCAHELGHMVLHAKVAEEFRDMFDYSYEERNQYEREANQFAASFLMPLPLVEVEFLAICRELGLDPAKLAADLMFESPESEQLWRTDVLPAFTKRFEVSATAAVIRFRSIQPRISTRRPVLPRAFVERFLEGVDARQQEFRFHRHA
ncbi:MAG: ImmA/IrrE family metallo-endopeptidase [Phycisphaerales bacterium]|nr:ImmA/IrrE family metallo-endopeptidase [Phycisphaerales bacterium]